MGNVEAGAVVPEVGYSESDHDVEVGAVVPEVGYSETPHDVEVGAVVTEVGYSETPHDIEVGAVVVEVGYCVPPNLPSDISGTRSGNDLVLTWTDNSTNEAGFDIEYSSDGVTFSDVGSVGAGVTTFTHNNILSGKVYGDDLYYRITVYDSAGCETTTSAYTYTVTIIPIEQACPPVAIYQLVLYSPTGERLAIIDDYRSIQFGHEVNNPGFFTLQISYNDSKRSLFEENCILEVKRKVPNYLDWYTEFIGHCEDFSGAFFANGNTQYSVTGTGFNGLLGRVCIGYAPGTDESDKSGAAETVMKEYVLENRGSLATTANGREASTNLTTFSVEGDGGAGDTWSGKRGGKNLLQTLQDIANFSGIDFNVVTDESYGVGYYLFETHEDQLGDDLTTIGLDSSTGLNGAGNVPHVMSLLRGNIEEARFSEKHKGEINRVLTFGRDSVTGLSKVRHRDNASSIDGDNLNVREAMRGAGSQATNQEMDDLADEYLEENQFVEEFSFKPVDTPSSIYGRDYHIGDRLTVMIGDLERNKRLVRVSITVSGSGGGESNKQFEFADIP